MLTITASPPRIVWALVLAIKDWFIEYQMTKLCSITPYQNTGSIRSFANLKQRNAKNLKNQDLYSTALLQRPNWWQGGQNSKKFEAIIACWIKKIVKNHFMDLHVSKLTIRQRFPRFQRSSLKNFCSRNAILFFGWWLSLFTLHKACYSGELVLLAGLVSN